MPLWPTNPDEQFFGRGLWGWVTDQWKKLRSDDDGNLFAVLAGQEYDLAVGCSDPDDLFVGLHGYDGNDWEPLSLLWGYSDRYAETISDTAMPAGNSNLSGSTVPVGEVWRVKGYCCEMVSGSCTGWRIAIKLAASYVFVDEVVAPTTTTLFPKNVDITLKAGEYVYARFYGMTLNDDAHLHLWGYKMAVQ